MTRSFFPQTCVIIIFSCFFIPRLGMSGPRIETAHLIFEDVDRQLSAEQFQRFSSDTEVTFKKLVDFWATGDRPDQRGKIILELYQQERGRDAFSVFGFEMTSEGRRRVVSVYGIKGPKEMVHKLAHALFPTDDKLIRNMIGIPSEARFGNPLSFPMCGFNTDSWVLALKPTGSYIPLKELREEHEAWGMTFKGKIPVVTDRKRQHASYIEAGSLGEFLLKKYGTEKVKAFYRASMSQKRPWQNIFGVDLALLEEEWLKSLDEYGRTVPDQVDFLTKLWKQNPVGACREAENSFTKKQ